MGVQLVSGPGTVSRRQTRRPKAWAPKKVLPGAVEVSGSNLLLDALCFQRHAGASKVCRRSYRYVEARAQPATQYASPRLGLPNASAGAVEASGGSISHDPLWLRRHGGWRSRTPSLHEICGLGKLITESQLQAAVHLRQEYIVQMIQKGPWFAQPLAPGSGQEVGEGVQRSALVSIQIPI